MNDNLRAEAISRQRAYDLGKYEAVMHRTKIGDKLRSDTVNDFNRKYSGMLGHLQQSVRRDQEPYRRGYQVGTLECSKLGYTVKRAQTMSLVPDRQASVPGLEYTENSVYKSEAKQVAELTKQTQAIKQDYVDSTRQSRQSGYNVETQNQNWDKLVHFYQFSMRTHNTQIDLDCAKARAEDYLRQYYKTGSGKNTKNIDREWNEAHHADQKTLLSFHPELINDSRKQKQTMREMNPTTYLANPAYFDKRVVFDKLANKHRPHLLSNMHKAIEKIASIGINVDSDHEMPNSGY